MLIALSFNQMAAQYREETRRVKGGLLFFHVSNALRA
jgi:hypothetical protein